MIEFSDFLRETAVFHRNSQLNPALWDGDALRPDVRTKLLNFAEAWRSFAKIPREDVLDELMVGGNAGYFYNDDSDIDVHLLIDRSALGLGSYVDDYLQDKKAEWTSRYDVRVKGYPIEPYAQDVSERFTSGQGVYSLTRGEWLQRPTDVDYDPTADERLQRRVGTLSRAIDKLIEKNADSGEFDLLKKKISDMRSRSLKRGGELGRGNLAFKILRLDGALDRMADFVKRKRAEALSLE